MHKPGSVRRCSSCPLRLTKAMHSDSNLRDMKVPSTQALFSPFSPVFDLELDSKRVNSSAGFDRCQSEQHFADDGSARPPTLLQQILLLCRCTTPIAAQLLQELQQLRNTFVTAASAVSPDSSPTVPESGAAGPGFMVSESSMDIEAMACQLLASGYLVQVRDGAQQQERSKNPRSCLQNLRHRFIVCLGWRSRADAEPEYLPEPIVVEPRFREQFAIAHPTREYELLLQSVPPCFVGPAANLEAVVKLLCEQMVAAFKIQGLPVPPWRTRQALLSKWSPTQLAELAAKIANVRRLSVDMSAPAAGASADIGCSHAHEHLRNGARPAAVGKHAAVGSAPSVAGDGNATSTAVAAWQGANLGGQQQLTHEQLMMILPNDMQQQLHQTTSQVPASAAGTTHARGICASQIARASAGNPALLQASMFTSGARCAAVPETGVPISAIAGPLGPPAAIGAPAVVPALPLGAVSGTAASGAAGIAMVASQRGPQGVSPAAADVLALLEAAEGLTAGNAASSTLKFTRKASAEWKQPRTRKGQLAHLLKKPAGSGSRSGLGAAGAAGLSSVDASIASQYSHMSGNGAVSAAAAAAVVAASGMGGSTPVAGAGRESSGSDALIRRTHYRPTGDEPWRRITTVRWGAYAPAAAATAAAAAAQQHPSQMQPAQQTPRPLATS